MSTTISDVADHKAILEFYVDIFGLRILSGSGFVGMAIGIAAILPWVLGLTNAMNLIDGIDGLAVGVSIISGEGERTIGLGTAARQALEHLSKRYDFAALPPKSLQERAKL